MVQAQKIFPPKLDAPGAGLPRMELLVATISFLVYRKLHDRDYASRHFHKEARQLLDVVNHISQDRGRAQVLTERFFGIEDSSRFWSPYMVLHHLIIVDSAIIKVIETLAVGKSDLREAKIADVKPNPDSGPEVIEQFQIVVQDYQERLTKISDLATARTHAHPWFGKLDGHGWHCLAALHHGIHKRQLTGILATRM